MISLFLVLDDFVAVQRCLELESIVVTGYALWCHHDDLLDALFRAGLL